MTHHLRRWVRQGIHVALLAALTCAAVQPVGAADSAQRIPRPRPIEAALDLLHWPADQTPTIVVVAERPETASLLAEGWMVRDRDGRARPTIYVAGWSELYRNALAKPDVLHNIIRLAGVLAHEQVHIRNGPDEELAYAEQLITLERLYAAPLEITNVRTFDFRLLLQAALRMPNCPLFSGGAYNQRAAKVETVGVSVFSRRLEPSPL